MGESTLLVQKNSRGQIKVMEVQWEGHKVIRTWGIMDGKMQTSESVFKATNVGKANMMSPAEVAVANYFKIIDKKIMEGYKVTPSLNHLPDLDEEPLENLDYDAIDTGFCLSKPIVKPAEITIDRIIDKGTGRFFVKYNGGCHFFVVNASGNIRIFTRRWDDHTVKYPTIVEAVQAHDFPPETIGAMELCVDPLMGLDHMVAFQKFSKITKVATLKGACEKDQTKCHELQKVYPIKGAVFALLYVGGEQIWHWPYGDMFYEIERFVKPLSAKQDLFIAQEAAFTSASEAFSTAKIYKKQFEGFVFWDMSQAMEVTMNGKPARRAAHKIKALGEMEAIAVKGVYGKKEGLYGSIEIGRYGPYGEWHSLGTAGGLKHKQGEADPYYWEFPCVVEIQYDNIFPDTGLPQFPRFLKKHEDKELAEVPLFGND